MRHRLGAGAVSSLATLSLLLAGAGGTAGKLSAQSASPVPPLPAAARDGCSALAEMKLANVEITLARSQPADGPIASVELASMYGKSATVGSKLPAFCRVVGHIHPVKGSDIGFEVWMPSTGWDGRLHGIGIGGFAGGIDYYSLGLALKAGQAGLATDTGHSGTMMESGWAGGNPEKVVDYGWRGVHLSTVAAKKIIAQFYGHGPDKSYFVGCSGGGRQGLMEAGRFPEDYDGVLAGAPAASWTDLSMAITNGVQAQIGADAFIRRDQTRFLQDEVLRQCDGKDGLVDGLVDDPRQCQFDAHKLGCDKSSSAQCFSPGQIAALIRIQRGAYDSHGHKLTGGYLPSGSEVGNPAPLLGWEGYIMRTPTERSGGDNLASGLLTQFIQKPFTTAATFDFDRDPARIKGMLSNELDAPTNLRRFFARGGKLILWHGWADAAIPPEATLRYRAGITKASGAQSDKSVRLFMVAGVQHCSGGLGPDAFGQAGAPKPDETPDRNMVTALQAWVENKRSAPETFIARRGHGMVTNGKPERQKLLCAWPKKAVLHGDGSPDQAASYSCT